ncbi:NADH:quinone oxidoreductase [Aliiroseovarius subalbicans]|uniref:NADH:quinone oxidoreductase n=1 Tax=Aliiroseovarius subalbicans TaxID=2925840 RepID=UPI001F5A62FA|nr:NADH:quinone oxidoreductase [Aliiroseovarius subalbicans]MCI2398023.1 NADH:quinone oxidoreductase [Aliiroseovarius subalbicans]
MSETNQGIFSCKGVCWITGALLGLAAFLLLNKMMMWLLALVLGIVVLVVAAMTLRNLFCGEVEAAQMSMATSTADAPKSASPAAATETAKTQIAATQADGAADKPAAEPKAKAKPAAKAAKPAAKSAKPAAKAAAKPAAKAAAKPKRAPVAKDGKPETLSAARSGGADDLKQLKGVGPGLEKTLNELGFYHFDQIAGWRKKEVEWVDSRLKFKGRIERDEWIKQAKALAKTGKA